MWSTDPTGSDRNTQPLTPRFQSSMWTSTALVSTRQSVPSTAQSDNQAE